MSKRKLFIGSSTEALSAGVPSKIESLIANDSSFSNIEIVVWNTSEWQNLETAMKSLMDNIYQFDYAVFVQYPDDIIESRNQKYYTTRDNVIFEFGLFLSSLGANRTFLFSPRFSAPTYSFKQLSDIGTGAFVYTYSLRMSQDKFEFGGFDNSGIFIENLRLEEKTINELSKSKLEESVQIAKAELLKCNNEKSLIRAFKSNLNNVLLAKKGSTDHSIQDILFDILDTVNDVKDFCKPIELAKLQHHKNGISEVWVFADKPLEFEDDKNENAQALKYTILENLKQGVKYVYFVSGTTFNDETVTALVGDDTDLLKNIEVQCIESRWFKTFFTLHFKKKTSKPDSIYMSSLLDHRNDLLIQITNKDHKDRIFERISKLKGHLVKGLQFKKTDFIVKG